MVSKNYKTFGEDELDTPDQTTSRNSRRDETNRTPSSFSSRVTETDGMLEQVQKISGLNFNNYATRKTISQGLLNVTLLTTNATQLKRVLTSGNDNQFYTLLVWLIGASIFAQIALGLALCAVAIIFDLNKTEHHSRSKTANNVILIFTVLIVPINIFIKILQE